ncbi:MAG: hypothetical protein JRJ46_15470 [Deltaproteobacteria bacterium]|nr:hypothetical protein [Deltaproteobacteria bacterium]
MGSISEQDYKDILRESVGAWFKTDEDDEDEKNGFICKECIGGDYRQYDSADMLAEKKLNTFLIHGDINCDKCGKGGVNLRL